MVGRDGVGSDGQNEMGWMVKNEIIERTDRWMGLDGLVGWNDGCMDGMGRDGMGRDGMGRDGMG